MRRSIFKAGAVTVLGLLIAFAIVSANSNTRHAATTAAKADNAVATAPASTDECTSSDVCCAKETKVNPAAVAVAPKKAVKKAAPATSTPGSGGMIVGIDPETGQIGMPTPQQAADIQAQITPVEGNVILTALPGGGVMARQEGHAIEYATVHIDANGKKVFGCSPDKKAVEMPAPAPAQLEEK